MRKIISGVFVGFLLYSGSIFAFSDIENSWYKDAILELKDQGIINGFGDGSFGPDNSITRAEILKIILGSAKSDIPETLDETCFPDVDINQWYARYICYAAQQGIAKGYENGSFQPNGNVSILEALAFAGRTFKLDIPDSSGSAPWYESYIDFAHDNKIIPEYAYTIHTKALRGQVSQIITQVLDLESGKTPDYHSVGCSVSNTLASKNTITVNGKSRSYLLDLPRNYDSSKAYPLVVGLHGRTNSNAQVRDYMGLQGGSWTKVAEQDVIVAYPAGLGSGPFSWYQEENVDFFDAMISDINENVCVDRSSVHVVGHSMGAYFSNRLACLRGDVISTNTAVAGGGFSATCRGPAASLILHNVDDPLDPYASGTKARDIRLGINSCNVGVSKSSNFGPLNCTTWSECSAGAPVTFCDGYSTYGNQPHSWPVGGATGIYDFTSSIR